MDFYSLMPSIALLVNALLMYYIIIQKQNSPINKNYIFYSLNLLFLILIELVTLNLGAESLEIWFRIASIFWLSIGFWFLNFAYAFTSKKRDWKFFIMNFITLLSVIVSLFTNQVIKGVRYSASGPDEVIGNLFYPLVIISIAIPMVSGLYLIMQHGMITKNNSQRRAANLIFMGGIFSLLIAILAYLILPSVFNIKSPFRFAESVSVIHSFFIFLAIHDQRIFSLKLEDISSNLFSSMVDGVIVLNESKEIIHINDTAKEIFNLENDNDRNPLLSRILEEAYNINENRREEKEYQINGENKFILITRSTINSNEHKIGDMFFFKDITSRKETEKKLIESETKYRNIVEKHPHGIIETDLDGMITIVNQAYADLYEFNMEEMIGKKAWEIHTDEEFIKKIKDFLIISKDGTLEPTTQIAPRKTKSGKIIEIQIDWIYKRNSKGEATGHLTVVTDVTEKRKNERRLVQQKTMLAQAEELAHLGSWEYNIKTNMLHWSEELYKIFGVSEMEHTPSLDALEKILHPDYRDRILKNLKNFIAKGETLSQYEKIVRPDGEIRHLQTNAIKRKDENGEVTKIIGATLDVTDLRKMEEELLYSQKQLRALTEKLQLSREDERKFLAREIHDEFGQLLTALKMDVDLMIDDLENNNPKTDLMIMNLKAIESLIIKAITSVQNIATMLRPDVLDHLDLVSALEWQLKEFEKRFKINTSMRKEVIEQNFDDKTRLGLFRIFQEGLTNVARHSNATEVKVDLIINNSIFELKIVDNGIGISQDNLDSLKSIGIIGMRERIILLDGEIDIKNHEAGGVELHLKMPIYKDSYESNISR